GGRQKRGRRAEPKQGRSERRWFHFGNVVGGVQPDRDELRRRDRQMDINLCDLPGFTSRLNVDPVRLCQNLNIFSANFSVKELAAKFEAAERSHAVIPNPAAAG